MMNTQRQLDSIFFNDLDEFEDVLWKDSFLEPFSLKEELILTATISAECFYNDNNFGIYIAEVETAKKDKENLHVDNRCSRIKVKGVFQNPLTIGHTYYMKGSVDTYNDEKQLFVKQSFSNRPVTERGILAYLKTLRGLDKRANDIFRVFGMDSIDVLINNPQEVVNKVFGVGKLTVERCREQLESFEEHQIATITLLEWGLSEEEAIALVKNYGNDILFKIESNPYSLMKTTPKISFKNCDKIAFEFGFDMKKPERIEEGLIYSFETLFQMGHTCFPYMENEEIIKDGRGFLFHARNELSIKLNYKTMVKLFENKKTEYIVGERKYPIDLNKLGQSINTYDRSKYYKDKEDALYEIVEISVENIMNNIETLIDNNKLIVFKNNITTKTFFQYEKDIKNKVLSIERNKEKYPTNTISIITTILEQYLEEHSIVLETEQLDAVKEIVFNKGGFFVLNGSAGCGKTFLLKIVLDVLELLHRRLKTHCDMSVFAPTGKASKVVEEATGRDSMTVHRGLAYQQGEFNYNRFNELPSDYIILDESSMLDVELGSGLLLAINEESKVVFVGDIKQLPSVGPGAVLKDIINSNKVSVTTLLVPKRQTEESGIYDNANRVTRGEMIESSDNTKDFYLLNRNSDESILNGLTESISRMISKGKDFEEIQILTPQRGTLLGVDYLNYHLQKIFNPLKEGQIEVYKKSIEINGEKIKMTFRVGDKVIHIKNNYESILYSMLKKQLYPNSVGITNGEMGVIYSIEEVSEFKNNKVKTETRIIVKYGDEYVIYDGDFSQIELAYALTIHKSQGSGWDNILIPLSNSHNFMWDKNLLYTAITRGRKLVALLGSKYMGYQAIKSDKSQKRYTNLFSLLKE